MSLRQPAAATGIVARTVGGETVLVPIQGGVANFNCVHILTKVGGFLWRHLDGQRSSSDLCKLVREQFEVSDGYDVESDVERFLDELARRGLVKAAAPGTP